MLINSGVIPSTSPARSERSTAPRRCPITASVESTCEPAKTWNPISSGPLPFRSSRHPGRSSIGTPNRESGPAATTAADPKSGRNRSTARLDRSSPPRMASSLAESTETITSGSERNCSSISADLYGPAAKIRDGGNPASTAVANSPAEATSAPSPQSANTSQRPSDALAFSE